MSPNFLSISTEALFRYQIVSAIRTLLLAGVRRRQAIRRVAELNHCDQSFRRRRPSPRTLSRWLKAFESGGLPALEPELRPRIDASLVMRPELLEYLVLEKESDERAGVPELLRRARARGLIAPDERIDRTSVWRALKRLGVATTRITRLAESDMRRFVYPHRMMMVLSDGKHFRAGVDRLRRVALTFLDDATRYALYGVVGTSENPPLFLAGLHAAIRRHGLMSAMFLDRGPGFIADDTHAVFARLDVPFIHGTARYPEGHGKIEKFNQTSLHQLLRGFNGNAEIDADPVALSLRLNHWLETTYNRTPHEGEGLGNRTPERCWAGDARPLEFPESTDWLDDRFRLSFVRRASKDNIVPYEGLSYELPIGHAGKQVTLVRPVREPDVIYLREADRLVRLHPVDLVANAYSRRARRAPATADTNTVPPTTAASLKFDASFKPLVDPAGNYPERPASPTSPEDPDDQDR
jgi:transposase InsO family protein